MTLNRPATARFYKQNRPQQLRGFYHVAVTGSFTAAAEQMGLGQPAVTMQVQALERELRAKLFERKRGSVSLTPEGQVLFDVALPVIEALETIDTAFYERLGEIETGMVVCAATDSMILEVLPDLVEQFQVKFPNIELVLHSCTSLQAEDMVARGDADLGIGPVNALRRQIRFEPLDRCEYYVVVPRDHPLASSQRISLEHMTDYPLVAPILETDLWRTIQEALIRRDLHPRIPLRVASTLARFRYVEAGLGITIASLIGTPSLFAPKLVWVPLADDLPRTTIGLLTRTNSYLALPAKRFADFLAESVPGAITHSAPVFGSDPSRAS